jgi:cytochrome P450
MSLYGWIILVASVGGTTGFLVWCLARVLRNHGKQDSLRATADLDPRETDR